MSDAAYDPSTPVGLVRLLIPDKVEVPNTYPEGGVTYLRADAHTPPRLPLNLPDPGLGGADACDLIGTDELLIGKVIITDDLATDASKVSQQMQARAKSLRDLALKFGTQGTGEDLVVSDLAGSRTYWPYAVYGYDGYPRGPELVDQVPFPYSGF